MKSIKETLKEIKTLKEADAILVYPKNSSTPYKINYKELRQNISSTVGENKNRNIFVALVDVGGESVIELENTFGEDALIINQTLAGNGQFRLTKSDTTNFKNAYYTAIPTETSLAFANTLYPPLSKYISDNSNIIFQAKISTIDFIGELLDYQDATSNPIYIFTLIEPI